jgi:hypothetical protein
MASSDVRAAIARAAVKYGVDPRMLMSFARIESGGDPGARTGSYKGLFQLSDREFNKYGGGDIYDAEANANAGAAKLKAQTDQFRQKYGRDPSANDLYMIHQQGEGGYAKHSGNPGGLAWQNMYATAEGQAKGPGWAKRAIWGNVPDDLKSQYGSVDNLTSQQFMDLWAKKVEGHSGKDLPAVSSSSQPSAKSPQEGNVLEFLQALGGSGNLMGSLGKALGSETMGNMAGSNNIFGSLSAMFGGQGGGESGVGQGGNAVGDQNMQLAQQGMKAAGSQEDSIPTYQRKPVDLANLAKILQQRAALGAGPRQGQSGLGA